MLHDCDDDEEQCCGKERTANGRADCDAEDGLPWKGLGNVLRRFGAAVGLASPMSRFSCGGRGVVLTGGRCSMNQKMIHARCSQD